MIIVQMADGQEQAYEATSWSTLLDGALEIRVPDDDARLHPVAAIAPGQWRTVRHMSVLAEDPVKKERDHALTALRRIQRGVGLDTASGEVIIDPRIMAAATVAAIEDGDF